MKAAGLWHQLIEIFKKLGRLLRPGKPVARQAPGGTHHDRITPRQDYPASRERVFRVYTPSHYHHDTPMPMVMVLHGCLQDHLDIQKITRFDELADQHGFIVVYPYVTDYSDMRVRNCWGWWLHKHVKPGSGEVEDLWQIAEQVSGEFSVDRHRIHIAGLSSGACMTVAALTVHVDRFASGMAVAGVAYGEGPRAAVDVPFSSKRRYHNTEKTVAEMSKVRNNAPNLAPLLVVHSHQDEAVHTQAAYNLRDSWLSYADAGHLTVREKHAITAGTPWQHSRYQRRLGASVVETLFLEGPGHGWYGGAPGKYSYPDAPDIAEIAWQFFRQHPLR